MQRSTLFASSLTALLTLSCGGSEPASEVTTEGAEQAHEEAAQAPEDHGHDEAPLESLRLGELELELAQGHGGIAAGKECHLVVKLGDSDQGATLVRAWIGGEDRTLSYVGKGTYAPSHDDYDVHATAPDPLPEGALWWIELERPDGTKLVGSARPLFE